MSAKTGTATSVGNLIELLDAFLRLGHALDPQYGVANVGGGVINLLIGTAASVNETITCTATDATHFAVVGSISGALGTATVGTAFTSAKVGFTIAAGSPAWVAGDTITFVMTLPWTNLLSVTSQQKIWSAPGNDGLANIVVGINRFTSVAGDYDDLNLLGAFGYDAGQDFTHQPNGNTNEYVPLLRVGNMTYWFVANGRRVIVVVKVSTTYMSFYLGFINPYASPSQFPYPLAIGSCLSWGPDSVTPPPVDDPRWRWSYTGNEMHAFPIAYNGAALDQASQMLLRGPDGVWRGFDQNSGNDVAPGKIWPYCGYMNNLRPNLDASYFLTPVVLLYDDGITESVVTERNTFGELDGIAGTTGYNQVSENTVTIAKITWLIVQDVFRTTTTDYFAVKLA